MPHLRTALVTGGSGAIGHHVCRELIRRGTFVIVHASTDADARAAVDQLVQDGADPTLIRAANADFRCLKEVVTLAAQLRSEHSRLDLLINDAATFTSSERTNDGYEANFQVNYLAPYALTRLLAPALNAAAGRIVTLTSALPSDACLDLDEPVGGPDRPGEMHARAQLASVLFTRDAGADRRAAGDCGGGQSCGRQRRSGAPRCRPPPQGRQRWLLRGTAARATLATGL